MEFKVRFYFSPLADTDEFDARNIAAALNRLGYWLPDPKTGLAPFDPDRKFFGAIRKFQNDHGLFPDAALRPGGETEAAINAALDRLEESGGFYAWRTVRDDHVRPAHAVREGRLFRWSENLPSGHPGEDHNCRCWAEPLYAGYQPPPIPKRKPEVVVGQPQEENLYPDAIRPVYPIETILGLGVSGRIIPTVRAISQLGKAAKLNSERRMKYERSQLQSKFKHAKENGIEGNPNNNTLKQFEELIQKHVSDPDTQIIKGSYHTEKVTHYYNPKTNLNVMKDKTGFYKSGPWKLGQKQVENLLRSGKLGGGSK